MAHINVNEQFPGIRSLLAFRPEVATPLGNLANLLLGENNGITAAEREMIGAHVSYLRDCFYCQQSHASIACEHLGGQHSLVAQVTFEGPAAPVTPKFSALLAIAAGVQRSGKNVTAQQVQSAKDLGASDRDIHDTVLIAAMFCMFNRYVDGLAANTPDDLSGYQARAREVATHGYHGPAIQQITGLQ
jgi:uncharacterized peroxidase-related enzyme